MIPPLQSAADEHTIILARRTVESESGALNIEWRANIIHNDTVVATVEPSLSLEHVIGQAIGAAVVCAAKNIGVEGLACQETPPK
jgi:hypothetical protein